MERRSSWTSRRLSTQGAPCSRLSVFDQAIAFAPDKVSLYASRAYARMFLDRTDAARALYLHYRGREKVRGDQAWEEVILTDFAGLREKGLTHPMMGEIEQKFNSPETAAGTPGQPAATSAPQPAQVAR